MRQESRIAYLRNIHVHVACTHHIHTSLKQSLVYRAEKLFAVLTAFIRVECLRGLGLRLRPRLLPQRCQMPTEPLARKTYPSRMDLPCTRSSPSSRRTHQRRSPCTSLQPSEPLARKTDPSRMDLPCTRSSTTRCSARRRSWRPPPLALLAAYSKSVLDWFSLHAA